MFGRGRLAVDMGQCQFHPTAAALADLGSKRHVHCRAGFVARQHLPGAVDGHIFQLAAADGTFGGLGGDGHHRPRLARDGAARAGDLDPDHLSFSIAISTRSGVAGASMRGFSR